MSDLKAKLHRAVVQGDLTVVKDLLGCFDISDATKDSRRKKKRPRLDALTDPYKFDLLNAAVNKKNVEMVKLLLAKNFKVSDADEHAISSNSPLHAAIKTGNTELIEVLLKHKSANANVRNNENQNTLLFEAVRRGNVDVVKLILKYGAVVNASNNSGTALHEAIRKQNVEVVKILLKNGADANEKLECYKASSVQEAIKTKNTKLFQLVLSSGAKISHSSLEASKLVSYAVKNGNEEMVKDLLDFGIDVNASDETGSSPLFFAVQAKREEMVNLLLSRGATVDDSKSNQVPVLHIAANHNSAKIVQKLLDYGAEVNCKSEINNKIALHCASEKGFTEIAKLLLNHGADSTALDDCNFNSLDYAFKSGCREIVEMLLDLGKIQMSSDNVTLALHSAASKGHLEIVKLLLGQQNLDLALALHLAVENGHDEIAKHLILSCGVDVNSLDQESGKTPLHRAVEAGKMKTLTLLLNNGADVNGKSRCGSTSLHFAAKAKNLKIAKILLDLGVTIDETDGFGRTALHYASTDVSIALHLIRRGADFNITDKDDKTFIDECIRLKRMKTVAVLLQLLIKLKCLRGVEISEKIMQLGERIKELKTFVGQCEREIVAMKEKKFQGLGMTFYDILQVKSPDQLQSVIETNKGVYQFLDSKDLKINFPIFFDMIEQHFENVAAK